MAPDPGATVVKRAGGGGRVAPSGMGGAQARRNVSPFFALSAATLSLLAILASRMEGERWQRVASLTGASFTFLVCAAVPVEQGPPWKISWAPSIGYGLSMQLDPLGSTYALLITGILVLVLWYAGPYLSSHLARKKSVSRGRTYFLAWMMLFAISMLGLVFAKDLILLFLFFDLTAICSYFLIAFDHREPEVREAALTALLVTGILSLPFLVAILILRFASGSFSIDEVIAGTPAGVSLELSLLLIGCAAMAKSAQVPFHFWLPRAMVAPTPVSAYLHSAAMVAAGVFVLTRLHPLLERAPIARTVLLFSGALSIAVGASWAITSGKLKRILAFSTIAHYGHVLVLLGLGGTKAAGAATAYVVVHALAKSGLFLSAGAITEITGQDDLEKIGGLGRTHRGLAVSTGICAAALAGFPLTAGYFKEELWFERTSAEMGWIVAPVLASSLTVVYMWRFWSTLFLGDPKGSRNSVARALVWPTAILAALLLMGGIVSVPVSEIARTASLAVHGEIGSFDLGYDFDARITNWMALGGWCAAIGLIVTLRTWQPLFRRSITVLGTVGPSRMWDGMMIGARRVSDFIYDLELRDLRDRLAAILAPGALLLIAALVAAWPEVAFSFEPVRERQVVLLISLAATAAAALMSVFCRRHLSIILMMTASGYTLSFVFALFGAPDVALISVLVGTTLTFLLVVVLNGFPTEELEKATRESGPVHRARWHTVAAAVAGLAAMTVSWIALTIHSPRIVAQRHLNLAELAHANNSVAAIIVDFRGLDTLAEATVVVVAFLVISTLVQQRRRHE